MPYWIILSFVSVFLTSFTTQLISGLQVSIPDNNIEINSGETLTLKCLITDAPDNTRIYWMFNGDRNNFDSRTDESIQEFNYESEVTIGNVNKDHSGTYFCLASNEAAELQSSAAAYVKVRYAPISLTTGYRKVRILERFPTHIEFEVEGYPEPQIHIYHNDIELSDVYDSINLTLTLPYLTQPIETIAQNDMGAIEMSVDYTIIRLIESRSIFVQSYSTYFDIKIASDILTDGSTGQGLMSSPVFLIMVEEFSQQRLRTPPIQIELSGFASCSEDDSPLIHNIVDDLQKSSRTDEAFQTRKLFVPIVESRDLKPDTSYLVWVLESSTFICPDGRHYALTQPSRASDYIISNTLVATEEQTSDDDDSKINEILLSIIIAIGAIAVLMILVSITICVVHRNLWRGTKELATDTNDKELKYFTTDPTGQNRIVDSTPTFIPINIETLQALSNTGGTSPQTLQQLAVPLGSQNENVYCMPDEYGTRHVIERPVTRNSYNSRQSDYLPRIAHPVYIGNNSSSASELKMSPVQQQPMFLKGYMQKYASSGEVNNGFDNHGFQRSNPNILYRNISPRSDEERMSRPGSWTPIPNSTLEHPRTEYLQQSSSNTHVEHVSSSSSSNRTDNASKNGEYYNNSYLKMITLHEYEVPRLVPVYERQRNRNSSSNVRPRHLPEMRSLKLFEDIRSPQSSTISLPDLVATKEHHNDTFSSLPREHRMFHGREMKLAPRSQSTSELNRNHNAIEDGYFYMQI